MHAVTSSFSSRLWFLSEWNSF